MKSDATINGSRGITAAVLGISALVSPFVSGPLSRSAIVLCAVGVALAVAAIWFGILAARSTAGTPGRGAGIAGIVLGVLALLFVGMIAFGLYMTLHDTTL